MDVTQLSDLNRQKSFIITETTYLPTGKKITRKAPDTTPDFSFPNLPIQTVKDSSRQYYVRILEGTLLTNKHASITVSAGQTSAKEIRETTYRAALSVIFGPALVSIKKEAPSGTSIEDADESLPQTPAEAPSPENRSRPRSRRESRLPSIPEAEDA